MADQAKHVFVIVHVCFLVRQVSINQLGKKRHCLRKRLSLPTQVERGAGSRCLECAALSALWKAATSRRRTDLCVVSCPEGTSPDTSAQSKAATSRPTPNMFFPEGCLTQA